MQIALGAFVPLPPFTFTCLLLQHNTHKQRVPLHMLPLPRVTDDLDRRCLMSVLRQFICPRVLRQECAPLSSSGTYCVPKDGDLESYIQAIRALPR